MLFVFLSHLTIIFLNSYELIIDQAYWDPVSITKLKAIRLWFESLKKFEFQILLCLLQNQVLKVRFFEVIAIIKIEFDCHLFINFVDWISFY